MRIKLSIIGASHPLLPTSRGNAQVSKVCDCSFLIVFTCHCVSQQKGISPDQGTSAFVEMCAINNQGDP